MPGPKTLKFDARFVEPILAGTKTSTWRLFDDKDLAEGDRLVLINRETGDAFAEATIVSVREKPLRDVTDDDFEGHARYESEAAMHESFRRHYGDRVGPDSLLKIVTFALSSR